MAKKAAQAQIKESSKLIFVSRVEVAEGGGPRWILTLLIHAKNNNMYSEEKFQVVERVPTEQEAGFGTELKS